MMLSWIVVLQLATAATFLVIGLAAYRHGATAQQAAEAEVLRQGASPDVLARHHVRITESLAELLFPLGIALLLVVLATLNLAAPAIGRPATFIFQPVLLIAGGFITGSQVFVTRLTASAFRKSADPEAHSISIGKVLDAVSRAFPIWLRPLIVTRFLLVTLGSAVVLALLLAG